MLVSTNILIFAIINQITAIDKTHNGHQPLKNGDI